MKVGYVQNSPIFGKKDKNFEQVRKLIEGRKLDLLVLSELFAIGYAFTSKQEAFDLSEDENGDTTRFLKEISAKTGGVIVAGFVEKDEKSAYNSSILVYQDQVIDIYRKIHLFNKEKLWFSPGDKPYSVHTVKGMRVGMMICFDWMFPEAARTLTLKGAQIIAHPANLVLPFCQKAMVTRCLENRVFAITANRVGNEKRGDDNFTFTGGSQIVSPKGEILSAALTDQIFIDVVDVDLTLADNKMVNEFNDVIGDRHPDFYQ